MRLFISVVLFFVASLAAQPPVKMSVDFSRHLRSWDGFGVNYVQVAQTRDYQADPQEYGGFSLLSEEERRQALDMIFGPDGLKPGLVKMFLDPFHEPVNDNSYPDRIDPSKFDHTTTSEWMRYFVREGLRRTRARGADLQIITTLYGPPAWCTKQKFVRGRDLDPALKREVSEYIIAWAKYLRETEKFPVRYIAFHNEGEDWERWPADGSTGGDARHDYNLYWPPEQVADFIGFTRGMLDRQGLKDVGIAPGETTNWYRFHEWGYAGAIARDPAAMKHLALITSHGFISFKPGRWFADWRSAGVDLLREKKPSLHAWVTSQSWSQMDVDMLNQMRGNIYAAKVNGIIPWAAVQRAAKWVGGDPNPGTAFNVDEQGNLAVRPGYHFYKQFSRAGQPGMMVAEVSSNDTEVLAAAFARGRTAHADAFVVLNLRNVPRLVEIRITGAGAQSFEAFRSSPNESYSSGGRVSASGGVMSYTAPARSATTFFAAGP